MTAQVKWYVVNATHLKKFTRYIAYWQEQLGLRAWRIHVSDIRCKSGLGEIFKTDLEQRSATVRLAERFRNTKPTDLELDKLAFHELMHVLNHEMKVWAAEHGEPDCSDAISAEHIQINVLEALIFKGRK